LKLASFLYAVHVWRLTWVGYGITTNRIGFGRTKT